MVGTRDTLRDEAFKFILQDIEKSPSRYKTKAGQENRIKVLIEQKKLQIKKGNAKKLHTPQAAELRSLLITHVSKNSMPYRGVDVFTAGSNTLDTEQLNVLKGVRPRIKLQAIEALDVATVSETPNSSHTSTAGAEGGVYAANAVEAEEAEETTKSFGHCSCRQQDDQQMVTCANESCDFKRFHLACVGLETVPNDEENWYCPGCKLPELHQEPNDGKTDAGKKNGKKRMHEQAFGVEEAAPSATRGPKLLKLNVKAPATVSVSERPDSASAPDSKRGDAETPRATGADMPSAEHFLEASTTSSKVARTAVHRQQSPSAAGAKRKRDDDLESEPPNKRQAHEKPSQPTTEAGCAAEPQSTAGTKRKGEDGQGLEAPNERQAQEKLSSSMTRAGSVAEPERHADTTEPQPQVLEISGMQTVFDQEPIVAPPQGVVNATSAAASVNRPPKEYCGSPGDIRDQMQSIYLRMRSIALHLYLDLDLTKSSVPAFATNPSKELERLYQRMLGDGSAWREQVLMQDPVHMDWARTLQALVGAAVYEKIWSKPVPWQTPQELLAQLQPFKAKYDRLLLEITGFAHHCDLTWFVWRTGMNVLEDENFVKEQVEPIARDLGRALIMEIQSHMQQCFGTRNFPASASGDPWKFATEEATRLCTEALILRGRLNASAFDYEFYWKSPGEQVVFYWALDATKIDGQGNAIDEVITCMLPGVKYTDEDGEEMQASKAWVFGKRTKN